MAFRRCVGEIFLRCKTGIEAYQTTRSGRKSALLPGNSVSLSSESEQLVFPGLHQ